MVRLVCGALSLGTLLLWCAGCHEYLESLAGVFLHQPTPLSRAEPVWEHLAARRQTSGQPERVGAACSLRGLDA